MTISATPALEVRNLGKDYIQAQPFSRAQFTIRAFEDIDLTVQRGETLAIVGESGAGKSSLARCLVLLKVRRGANSSLTANPLSIFRSRSYSSCAGRFR